MFKTLSDTPTRVDIWFNGQPLAVPGDRSVAAALLAAGVSRFRSTPVSGAARAPFCMMGACFECLVEIDGVPSRQSCMVPVRAGMHIRSQEGARDLPPEPGADLDTLENAHAR
ncbi:2Fe-2S iron-sulfur cluster binding domain-containing protein [Paraburkholderia lycopersici]|uniref:2Fe-2S iron-sulfur cluster binding domain-containing protein n=1 Tax=Paraburkholderia lycopersici TaxID=416944 RepID=A0A1G7BQG7_9BURK|nr:2Fe-2S iron-sulfur cluster binding domain-containing protein [Paraburkholderia lycopersici]